MSAQDLWFRRYQPAHAPRATLFCFPHAGGSASYFHPMCKALAPEFDVLAVQYPGRQDRFGEPPIPTVDALADAIHAEITPHMAGPAAFFGHSMGSAVAFEVARRLERDGHPAPALLFASGGRAPSRVHDDGVHRLGDAGLIAQLRAMGGTDARVLMDPDLLELVLPPLRNDYRAIETYRREPDARIGAPIVVMIATDDPRTGPEDVRAWHGHTTAGGTSHLFQGGHFYLESQGARVAEVIGGTLRDHLAGRYRPEDPTGRDASPHP
ncbi:thioesterase II family protein [Streptomyces sp. NPDC014940]|uniref:thioesterase II family protein n=1 Tax=unclassified Streptomyces TaxID=2593676 RepID=UPI003406A90C